MSHNHEYHNHGHKKENYNRAFTVGVTLNIIYIVVEATYGIFTNSMALLADAGHNVSDVIGLLLAWGASALASKKATPRRTYGFRRLTILASMFSGLLLLAAIGAIAWEAVRRFATPVPVSGMTIIVVAAIGVVINTITAMMFISGRKHDLNIKGAYLHMAADAAVSLGVVIAGIAIMQTGWLWLDPSISLVIAAIILIGTWSLLSESMSLAIDSVPAGIDPIEVKKYLHNLPEVSEMHDLHIWAMSTTQVALTAHLVIPDPCVGDNFLHGVCEHLHVKFGIEHSTIQIERGDGEKTCNLDHAD